MEYIWLSFSYNGKNQGCCNVKADSPGKALEICDEIGITPDYDDIVAFKIDEPELPLNQLIDPDHLKEHGWPSLKNTVCEECGRSILNEM